MKKTHLFLLMVVILAGVIKIILLVIGVLPFNADEAIVGLMGRHILAGERPVFFYGQAYMGSLDSFLVAAGFSVFGDYTWVIRLVQILLYLGTVYTTYWIAALIFHNNWISLASALLMAVPSVNVTLYTTVSLGGYGEALLIGNILILLALTITQRMTAKSIMYQIWILIILWGFCAGFGLWANGLTLVYAIPAGIFILRRFLPRSQKHQIPDGSIPATPSRLGVFFLAVMIGFLAGSIPVWVFAYKNGVQILVHELMGSAVSVNQASWISQVGLRALSFFLFGVPALLGMRPPWEIHWLVLPLIPFILTFWIWVLVSFIKNLRKKGETQQEEMMLAGIILVILVGFIMTPFGNDPSGRYFLPMAMPLAVLAAKATTYLSLRLIRYRSLLILFVCIFHLVGIAQCALRFPPGLTTQFDNTTIIDHRYDQNLINFLSENDETRGYTTYWVAYPLAFLSGEQLVFIPRLPYHRDFRYTERDDRYAPYRDMVEASPRVAYITANNPGLDGYLRDKMVEKQIQFTEAEIGDYRVFYNLSARISPQELDLESLQ